MIILLAIALLLVIIIILLLPGKSKNDSQPLIQYQPTMLNQSDTTILDQPTIVGQSDSIDVDSFDRPPRWLYKAKSLKTQALSATLRAQATGQKSLTPPPCTSFSAPISLGNNINLTNLSCGPQSETYVAINKFNQNQVMAGSNDILTAFMISYYTPNKGTNWNLCHLAVPAPLKANTTVFASDPCIDWSSKDGFCYYGCVIIYSNLSFTRTLASKMQIAQFNPTTGTFKYFYTGFLSGSSPSNDKPMIAVNNNALSPKYGNVYLMWDVVTNNSSSGNKIQLAELVPSTGQITTVTPSVSQNSVIGSTITIGTDDSIYLSWHDDNSSGKGIMFTKSAPGTLTFSSPVTVVKTNVAFDIIIPPQNKRGILVYPVIAYTSTALYIVFADQSLSDSKTHLYLFISNNGGSSWTGPFSPVDAGGTNSYQFSPWMSFDPISNSLHISWYDTRNDPTNNILTDIYHTVYSNGSFSTNQRVSTFSSNEQQTGSDGNQYGDYQGLSSYNNFTVGCWTSSQYLNQPCGSRTVGEEVFLSQM